MTSQIDESGETLKALRDEASAYARLVAEIHEPLAGSVAYEAFLVGARAALNRHPEAAGAQHLVHCNAGSKTPLGEGICICLHELREAAGAKGGCEDLPPIPEGWSRADLGEIGYHSVVSKFWMLTAKAFEAQNARLLSAASAPASPAEGAGCKTCDGSGILAWDNEHGEPRASECPDCASPPNEPEEDDETGCVNCEKTWKEHPHPECHHYDDERK
jgi:hypothetical protein